ncbi:MAG TPA: hypothetical protein VG148_12155 [Pyrinomonadaceae bacterium]|nr:hypothetical protein [Pyrinomonadaceae bacterium]
MLFLVGACYLVAAALYGAAAHALVRLLMAAADRVAPQLYTLAGPL